MKKRLRILITNYGLENYGGSETYVRDIAEELVKRGHNPVIYAPKLGGMAEELRRKSVPVIDDLAAMREAPDVIHAQHHAESMQALLYFPHVPSISVCHGWLPWIDRPIVFPSIRRYVAVDDQCRERLLMMPGIDANKVLTHYNFVDFNKFKPRSPLPLKPSKVLIFNNFASRENYVLKVQAACKRQGISTVEVMGRAEGTQHPEPGLFLGNYDVVFAKGRCALESMAVGCAVIMNDYSGMGGLVTSENMDYMRRFNFGYRPTMAGPLTEERVYDALLQYNANDAAKVSAYVRQHCGLKEALDKLEALYYEVLTEPFKKPAPEECMRMTAGYIKYLAEVLMQKPPPQKPTPQSVEHIDAKKQ